MIELYFWTTPNGYKPLIFLEEAGLKYTITPINISEGAQSSEAYTALVPNRKIPAITDWDPAESLAPLTLFESGAILNYLAEKTGRFLPFNPLERHQALQWLFWQKAGLGPMLGQYMHFTQFAPEKVDYGISRYKAETERLYGVLEGQLETREFIAGPYSIADIATFPWIYRVNDTFPHLLKDKPAINGWLARIGARPAVQRAYKIGANINQPQTVTRKSEKTLLAQ